MGVASSWLLQPSPDSPLAPGTRSVQHRRDDVAGGGLSFPAEDLEELDAVGQRQAA
jgi:aryl-alcohol dehydrogenase-like predicted oxidoreductase